MALAVSLSSTVTLNTTVSPARLTLPDSTGVYDSGTNLGGYGAPNPERNTLYILFFAFKVVGVDLVPAPVVAYNGLTATQAFAKIIGNGTYRAYLLTVTITAPGVSDLAGYVFYDTADDTIKQTITDGTAVGATTLLVNVGLDTTPPALSAVTTVTDLLVAGSFNTQDYAIALLSVQLKIERTAWITNSSGNVTGFTVTNTTGAYNAVTNPHGFGTPNMERSDVWIALFASIYDASTSPPSLIALPIANYNGITDDEYIVSLNGDAIIVIHAFALPIVEPVIPIPVGTQWYNLSDSAFMQTQFVDTIAGAIAVLDLNTALLGDAHGDVEIHDRNIQNAIEKRAEEYNESASPTNGCDCDSQAFKDYLRINAWLESGVIDNFDTADFYGAAKTLDAINAET